jgi:nucleotide-binding universal stress UspA family protein
MKRILLAFDGSEPAMHALETAASLARAFEAELAVVSVVPEHLAGGDEAGRRARILLQARKFLAEQGIDAELLEPAGDPAHKIEQIAAEGFYDTIVLGSPSRTGISRAVAGSVSGHVSAHSSATVVIAH